MSASQSKRPVAAKHAHPESRPPKLADQHRALVQPQTMNFRAPSVKLAYPAKGSDPPCQQALLGILFGLDKGRPVWPFRVPHSRPRPFDLPRFQTVEDER